VLNALVSGTITANIGSTAGLGLDSTLTGGSQRTRLTNGSNDASIINTAVAGTEYGLVVRVIPSGTQAISGSVSVSGTVTVAQATGTNLHTVVDSGTITANLGTIAGVATETTLSALNTKVPANLTVTATRLLVDGSGVTQPVSGTITANLGTIAGVATETTLSALNTKIPASLTVTATRLLVDGSGVTQPVSIAGTITAIGNKTNNAAAPGATNLGVLGAVATVANPTYGEGNLVALSTDLTGALRITGSISASNPSVSATGAAVPASGTQIAGSDGTNLRVPIVMNSTPAGTEYGLVVRIAGSAAGGTSSSFAAAFPGTGTAAGFSDGVNMVAGRIKPASTAALTTDPALVVAISPNNAITIFNGTLDAGNSSTATLGIGGVFTGTALDVFNQSTTQVFIFSNVSSAANGVSIQFSTDAVNWDEVYTQTFTAGGQALVLTVPVRGRYYRIVYTNGGGAQAAFRLQTIHKLMALGGDVIEMADVVRSTDHAQVTRAMLTALTPTPGVYGEVITHGTDTDAEPTRTVGALEVDAHVRGWNGTTFDRLRSGSTAADAQATSALGVLDTRNFLLGYNGTTWDRLRSTIANGLVVDVSRVVGTVTVAGTVTANLGTIAGVATETTLSALNTKIPTNLTVTATRLLVDGSGVTQPVSGTITANLGTIAGVATETTLGTRLADATFTGRINTLGQKTMAASTPVVLASDQAAIPVTQSGTWNVGTVTTLATLTTITNAVTVAQATRANLNANTTMQLAGADVTVTNPVPVKTAQTTGSAQTSVAGSATNVTVLVANTARRGATVYNDSSALLYLKLGATASVTSFTVKMVAEAYYEVPFGYTGIIDGIWASATGSARITEIT
jgi:hypothetical protein